MQTLFDLVPPAKPSRRDVVRMVRNAIQSAGLPLADVREAKRSIFGMHKLKTFHFVVYGQNGLNALVLVGSRSRDNVDDLRRWESIFGDGFRAAVAGVAGAAVSFRWLNGERFDIASLCSEYRPTFHLGASCN